MNTKTLQNKNKNAWKWKFTYTRSTIFGVYTSLGIRQVGNQIKVGNWTKSGKSKQSGKFNKKWLQSS